MKWVLCHYSEIGLKGKNRKVFEEKLKQLIKLKTNLFKIWRISGRILIKLEKEDFLRLEEIKNQLKTTFGIAYFAFCEREKKDIEIIQKKAVEILKNQKFKTFKISTKRSDKTFSLTSQQINEKVGEFVRVHLKKKVDLENPHITLFIEITPKWAFLYLEKIKGPGGLPISTGGKVVGLLSGGIDSPVACFYLMKRGVKVVFLHFHSYPLTKESSVPKVREIVKVLNKFQVKSEVYFVPFSEIQKEILLKTKEKFRVILYRRFMLRIAQKICEKEKAQGILTGESVGQVASQTLSNIKVIEQVTTFPIFRPLIGFDKEEIIKKAKEIGTFEISISPAQDCCSLFLPKHPATTTNLNEIKQQEKKINIKKLIEKALKLSKKEII